MSDMRQIKTDVARWGKSIDGVLSEYKGLESKYNDTKTSLGEEIKNIKESLTSVDSRLVKMAKGQTGPMAGARMITPEAKQVIDYVAKGILPTDTKAASIGDPESGGYMAPAEFVANIIPRLYDSGAIRSLAETMTVSGAIAQIPYETTDASGHWVGEGEGRDNSDGGKLGMANIPVDELVGTIQMSNRLLASAQVDVETYFTGRLVDKISRMTEQAFAVGTGYKQPQGLFTGTDVTTVASGKIKALTSDALLDLIGAVPTSAQAEAHYVMSNKTLVEVAKLKDTTGQYLLQPSLAAGLPPTIWGYPVAQTSFAPDTSADDNICMAFGDIAGAYKIVQSTAMSMTRDNLTGMSNGVTKIWFDSYVGGGLVMPSDIAYMEVGA